MKKSNLFYLPTLFLLVLGIPHIGIAGIPDDSEGFDYKIGREDSNGNPVYYELKRDYTINIPAYFSDASKLPVLQPNGLDYFKVIAEKWDPVNWDFIRLEKGGILTIKKGYRWDGASRPCKGLGTCGDNWEFDHHYRATVVHDTLYDLMRLGYLEPDTVHGYRGDTSVLIDLPWPFNWLEERIDGLTALILQSAIECYERDPESDTQDKNRRLADTMFYMISRQEGQGIAGAEVMYAAIRVGAACRTYNAWAPDPDDPDNPDRSEEFERAFNDQYLQQWKFHPFGLTAHRSDDGIELNWRIADEAGQAPPDYSLLPSVHKYMISRNGEPVVGNDGNVAILEPDETSYVDKNVELTHQYRYQVTMSQATDFDINSNDIVVIPIEGPGNALRLGFDGAVRSIWAGNTVSNDLIEWEDPLASVYSPDLVTLEAWVLPYATDESTHIYSFEYPRTAASGDFAPESIHLSWCGTENRFCIMRYDHSGNEPIKVLSNAEFEPNRWHHVALTNTRIRSDNDPLHECVLYVDGTRQASLSPTEDEKFTPWRWDTLSIGGSQLAGGTGTFKGLIDEARIWNQAKTEDLIRAEMCTSLKGSEPGLTALWHFDNPPDTTDINCFDFNLLADFLRSRGFEVNSDFPTLKICAAPDASSNANDVVVFSEFGDIEPIFAESEAMVPKPGTVILELDSFGRGAVSVDQLRVATMHDLCVDSFSITSESDFSCSDLGNNAVDVSIVDKAGIGRDEQANVEVLDLIPPEVTDVIASHAIIRSADDEMVRVTIDDAFVSDNCRNIGLGHCRIVSVTGNEPLIGAGGPEKPDYDIIDELNVNLRATSSPGIYRVYTIAIECRDGSGNVSAPATVDVTVGAANQSSTSGSGSVSLWSLAALLIFVLRQRLRLG